METHAFRDFDAFAGSVRGVDSVMLLEDPTRRSWIINHRRRCRARSQQKGRCECRSRQGRPQCRQDRTKYLICHHLARLPVPRLDKYDS